MLGDRKPLVTLAVIAFNQSRYVAEAIAGALFQDYSPLEVILSDDCSSDDTFEIMQRLARDYRGPHSVVLNRNPSNLNLGGHINSVNRLANGELVVAAAGDDVSLPDRVSRLVEAWLNTGKQSGLLHSAWRVITESGEVVGDQGCPDLEALVSAESAIVNNSRVVGATEAWDRSLFNRYGDFRDDLVHEDQALTFRSLLAGRPVTYVDRPLVLYRIAVGITATYFGASSRNTSKRSTLLMRLRTDAQQRLDDLKVFPSPVVEQATTRALARHDVALRFEAGMPGPVELTGLVRNVGPAQVARMVIKRLANTWRDRR